MGHDEFNIYLRYSTLYDFQVYFLCLNCLGTFLPVLGIFTYFSISKKTYLKNPSHIQNFNIFRKRNFWYKKNNKHLASSGMVWALTSKLAPKVTVWAVISDHISS